MRNATAGQCSVKNHTARCLTAKDFESTGLLHVQDWDAIAKKDNLNDMSTELRRLEAMVKEIHQEMLFLRSREEEMRNINGACSKHGRLRVSLRCHVNTSFFGGKVSVILIV